MGTKLVHWTLPAFTRNKIYRDVLQDRLSWDKEVPGQRKGELFTSFQCPGFQSKVKTWIIKGKERRGNDCISWRDQYVPIHQTCNNQKSGEIFCNKIYRRNQEDHQPLPGTYPLRNELHPYLIQHRIL